MWLMKGLELMLLLSGLMRYLLVIIFKMYYCEKFGELFGGN